ncbi:maestro heat-like repeat-containing protein family member 1 [Bombina bombina]|uniref:maestro heat-like repeat-containing protein family member 1 n=1 Tax=Bombina bombina TaxID=8345 RepID=UPI00235AE697|nr:maestro heat-like repeat-containing protein family member 1 [Bombina bombina]
MCPFLYRHKSNRVIGYVKCRIYDQDGLLTNDNTFQKTLNEQLLDDQNVENLDLDFPEFIGNLFGLCSDSSAKSFLNGIFRHIISSDGHTAILTSSFLACLLSIVGHHLHLQVLVVLDIITVHFKEIKHQDAKSNVLKALHFLTTWCPVEVTDKLLEEPLPYSSDTCLMWKSLAASPVSTPIVLQTLIDYTEQGNMQEQAISAMREIISALNNPEWIHETFPQLYSTVLKFLIMTIGDNFNDDQASKLLVAAMDILRRALEHCKDGDARQCLENSCFQQPKCPNNFYKAICLFTSSDIYHLKSFLIILFVFPLL